LAYGDVEIAEFQISKYFAAYSIDCRQWIIFQMTSLISAKWTTTPVRGSTFGNTVESVPILTLQCHCICCIALFHFGCCSHV